MLRFCLTNEQVSILERIVEQIKEFLDKWLPFDLPYLDNISIGSGGLVSIRGIIVGITIGLIIASFGTIYNKRFLGSFVRHMLRNDCLDHASAKTLYELGYLKNAGVRGAIKSGGSLSRWVRCVEEDEFYAELDKKRAEFEEANKDDKKAKFVEPKFKRDLNTMHFYIPEERKYKADIKFDAKGASIFSFVAVVIVAIALCVAMCYLLPDIIKMVDNFVSITSGK